MRQDNDYKVVITFWICVAATVISLGICGTICATVVRLYAK